MSDYYHLYKGNKIEFERESVYEVETRRNISNKFLDNLKSDFLGNKIDVEGFSGNRLIIYSDTNYVEKYLENRTEVKAYKKIPLLKHKGVYYKETTKNDLFQYLIQLREHTLSINDLIKKIDDHNQSNVKLINSAGDYIFLIESSAKDLKIPKECEEGIFFEKNIFTIGRYEANEIDPNYSGQEIEQKPYCEAFSLIDVAKAHDYIKTNFKLINTPRIALLDNGVYYKHYELESSVNIGLSKNFLDDNSDIMPKVEDLHGTACAGIIGAQQHSEKGFNGIAPGCEIIVYKICEGNNKDNFYSSNFSLIKAFYDSAFITKCDVISCSFSLSYKCIILENLIANIAKDGRDKLGIPIIFSAGNDEQEIKFPKTLKDVFTISASNLKNEPLDSNYGENVLVGAPGKNVVSTNLPGPYGDNNIEINDVNYLNYTYFGGTSASAPIVAGLIGLILQINPKLNIENLKKLIIKGSHPFVNTSSNNYGHGVVNILKTIKNINLKTNIMSDSKLNLTGNVLLSSSAGHNQFIYGSQLYGTNFGIFCDFIVHKPDENKKECEIIGANVKIINYKGILDLGILGQPTLELKKYKFGKDDKDEEIALVMDIKLQAIVAGESLQSQNVAINLEDKLVKEEHLFVVKRDLIRLNKNNPKNPIVNGVFENEFYYRDGLRYVERKVTEVPEEYYFSDSNLIYPDGHPLELNKPGAKCSNAINTLTIE